jgi:transposase
MASHIETGTMHPPINYTSQNLDHLGLVAGLYDELEIGKLLDTLIPQDFEQRDVSIGQAVKAMVINGLGFTQRTLYLMPKFFQDKPVELLIGAGITAEKLNDTTLGRALDSLYETGVTELYASIAAQAVKKLGLDCKTCHIDSTSFHVDGDYNSKEDAEGVIHLTKGYSRDHRPDLNQLGFQMITDNQAGIPVLMEALNGNSVDKTSFNDTVNTHIAQLKESVGLEYLIGDSALYVAKTLQDLADSLWISRVPETLTTARESIALIAPDLLETPDVASFRSLGMEYADIKQHWLVIYTPEAHARAVKNVNKQILKQTIQQEKDFQKLCRQAFACEEEAQKALDDFSKKRPLIEIANEQLIAVPHYDTSGRPKKGQKPSSFTYKIEGNLVVLLAEHQRRIERKSCYILATNQLDMEKLSPQDMINKYKDQQKVERGFRFLKDPLFMASTLFLKSPKRIMALTMIMTLSLLIYAALEYRIREALKQSENQFPNQKGETISNPTIRWIFQFFAGIHVLLVNEIQTIVLNMNNHHLLILHLLGKEYEKLYSGYS